MSTRLAAFALIAAFLMAAPDWCGPHRAQAGTIMDLVDNNGGVITVGPFTFTFTATSVSGDRTAAQVSVAPDGNNGLEFTIDPGLRLDSMADGVAKNLTIEISYTVTSTAPIGDAGLADDAFARFKANGAYSQVTETLSNGGTLFVGSGDTSQANVPHINFAPVMTLDVDDSGKLYTPARGAGENQDEAQLRFITNTFSTVPEPSTLGLWSVLFGLFAVVGSYQRMKRGTAAA